MNQVNQNKDLLYSKYETTNKKIIFQTNALILKLLGGVKLYLLLILAVEPLS